MGSKETLLSCSALGLERFHNNIVLHGEQRVGTLTYWIRWEDANIVIFCPSSQELITSSLSVARLTFSVFFRWKRPIGRKPGCVVPSFLSSAIAWRVQQFHSLINDGIDDGILCTNMPVLTMLRRLKKTKKTKKNVSFKNWTNDLPPKKNVTRIRVLHVYGTTPKIPLDFTISSSTRLQHSSPSMSRVTLIRQVS